MAVIPDTIIENVRKYINELEGHNIPVQGAILFGSYVSGKFSEYSDIDIAIISEAFSGDRFEDRRLIVPLRRKIDYRIEPMPFRSEEFNKGGILADEIKRTGQPITW